MYRIALVEKIGINGVMILETTAHELKRWSIDELEDIRHDAITRTKKALAFNG